MANKNLRKPIVELDKPKGKIIKYWESARQAADAYKFTQVIISYNVNGKTKQAKGHYFRFATSIEIEQYSKIVNIIDTPIIADATPIAPHIEDFNVPVEVIPETVNKSENQDNMLTPFQRLLEAGKKKLTDNSK